MIVNEFRVKSCILSTEFRVDLLVLVKRIFFPLAIADLHSKILDVPPVQLSSLSCSFQENLAE